MPYRFRTAPLASSAPSPGARYRFRPQRQSATPPEELVGAFDADMLEPPNIDLAHRPRVDNPDGSVSTIRSMSFNEDGQEVLVPTVISDGAGGFRIGSPDDAIAEYHRTGQHLGRFGTPAGATAYAQKLHQEQERQLGNTQQSPLSTLEQVGLTGLRVVPPIAAGLLAGGATALTGAGAPAAPGVGLAASGAASALSEWLAEHYEKARGARQDVSLGQTALAGVVGALPIGNAGREASLLKQLLSHTGQGAAIAGTAGAASSAIDDLEHGQPIDYGRAADAGWSNAKVGGAFGLGTSALGRFLARAQPRPEARITPPPEGFTPRGTVDEVNYTNYPWDRIRRDPGVGGPPAPLSVHDAEVLDAAPAPASRAAAWRPQGRGQVRDLGNVEPPAPFAFRDAELVEPDVAGAAAAPPVAGTGSYAGLRRLLGPGAAPSDLRQAAPPAENVPFGDVAQPGFPFGVEPPASHIPAGIPETAAPEPSALTRLFRGEKIPSGEQLPDWITERLKESGSLDAEGRWFTDDPEIADWYRIEAGPNSRIRTIDVPRSVVDKSRVSLNPEAARFSRDPGHEFFLDRQDIPSETATPEEEAPSIPENVLSFLQKQLGYSAEDIAAMSPEEAIATGRDRIASPNAVANREAGQFSRFGRADERAATGEERPRDLSLRATRLEDAWTRANSPDVDETARRAALKDWIRLTGQQADRQGRLNLKGGAKQDVPLTPDVTEYDPATGERSQRTAEPEKYTEGGEIIGSGFGPLAELARRHPMAAARAVGAAVGGIAGSEYDEDDPLRGALGGMAAGAMVPSGYKALRGFLGGIGKGGGRGLSKPFGAGAPHEDLFPWQRAESPGYAVPDVAEEIRPILDELETHYHNPTLKGKMDSVRKRYIGDAVDIVDGHIEDAKAAGLKQRAIYLTALKERLQDAPTSGEKILEKGGIPVSATRKATQGIRNLIYFLGTGGSFGSAAVNSTQPALSLKDVKLRNLLGGYGDMLSPAGRERSKFLTLERPMMEDDPLTDVASKMAKGGKSAYQKFMGAAQAPLRTTDSLNRRVVYNAALREAKDAGVSGQAAHEWALETVYSSQGEQGVLGQSPFSKGPVMGTLTPFTKFPTMFLSLASRAAKNPRSAGTRRLAALLGGAAAASAATGIDFEDALVSGGRPMGLDVAHPIRSVSEFLRDPMGRFPVTRALRHGVQHLPGGTPDDTVSDDLKALVTPYYLKKVLAEAEHVASGSHTTVGPSGDVDTHTPLEGLYHLIGLKSTRETELAESFREATDEGRQATTSRNRKIRTAKQALSSALETGDRAAAQEAGGQLSSRSKQDLMRRRTMSRWERYLQNQPPEIRRQLEARYGREIRALEAEAQR